MTYEHLSWHGGTKPQRTETDSREQSEEPPAEYWENKEMEQKEMNFDRDKDGNIICSGCGKRADRYNDYWLYSKTWCGSCFINRSHIIAKHVDLE